MTQSAQMAIGIGLIVALWALLMVFVGPKITPYTRKQWALLLATLILLATPIDCYIIFIVAPSPRVDPRHVAQVGAANLAICIPLLIVIGRKILKVKSRPAWPTK